ncbi:MAG: phospholipid carrier-dependent glycosyltransferase [Gammaproteobacteria bacterium]|nr:MAG: phospholipid carrier-dependent glycosyltransferase [Gammaproteobacteria bacterium]
MERPSTKALVALLLLLAFAFQGSRTLWMKDEQRYSNIALEMVRLGDWIHPRKHHEAYHWAKPPLTYWAIAASLELFGRHEWAARLPNSLAWLFTVLLTIAIGRRLVPDRALAAGVVQATLLLPFVAANVVSTDSLLMLWETLAMYGFVRWWFEPARPVAGRILMWLGFGLGFLTKGPPALMPLLAVLVWCAWQGNARRLPALFHPSGLLVFALAGLSWYLYVVLTVPGLLDYFIGEEVVARVATGHHHAPDALGAVRVYLPTILLGTLPWLPLLLWQRWRAPGPARPRDRDARRLLWLWLLLPLAIFFLSRSRLPFYLLPLSVPASLLMASHLHLDPLDRRWRTTLLAWCALLLALRFGAGLHHPRNDPSLLARAILAAAPFPPREIVLVDDRRIQGLNFYADAEVEVVRTDPAMAQAGQQPLAAELAEEEPARLYVVPEERTADFLREIARAGMNARQVGAYGKRGFWVVGEGAMAGFRDGG